VSGRIIVLGAVCLMASAAGATTLQHLDTRALTHGSHQIVVGTVERVESRWDERRTRIFTDVTLRVSRSLKGAPAERVTLTQLGGEVDGVRVTVHAAPVFVPGQETLVFVWRDRNGRAQVNGLAQGKFDITVGPGGRRFVRRTTPGLEISDARTLGMVRGLSMEAAQVDLDGLIAEIGAAVAEERR
jgi:hypothetical protein